MPLNLVRLALVVAAPSRSPLLFAWIWRLIQWAVCLALHTHSAVADKPLAISPLLFACDAGAWTWHGCHIQAEFSSHPLAQPLSPLHSCSSDVAPPDLVYMTCHRSAPIPSTSLCDVRGQRGRRAMPPDIRQRTDGRHGTHARHASNHVYRLLLIM